MNLNETQLNADARRFFLGAMSEDERAAFETAFIADEAAFDHVRVVEDDLVEQYVRGSMSSSDRHLFAASYLVSAANRDRIDLTRTMLKAVSGRVESEKAEGASIWEAITAFFVGNKLAMGSAFAVLAVVAVGWFALTRNSTNDLTRVEAPNVEANATQTVVETPLPTPDLASNGAVTDTNKPSPTPRNDNRPHETPKVGTPVLALFAGGVRGGGGMAQLDLPRSANGARLLLNLESRDYKIYSIEIVDPDGRLISKTGGLKPSGKAISVYVPASKLKQGDYMIKLSALNPQKQSESVADYPFRVLHKQ